MIMTCKRQFWGLRHLQDGFAIKGNFATCFVKEYLAAFIAKDGNGEEIVDKAGELMS
jgi:hypothetical protein